MSTKLRKKIKSLGAKVAILTSGLVAMNSSAQAYTIFQGEDLNNSNNNPLATTPNATKAQVNFLARLNNPVTETFENFSKGTTNPTLSFNVPSGIINATLTGKGQIDTVASGTTNGFGRYAISGSNFYEAEAGVNEAFTIEFDAPVAAFGFFGIDIGDFGGELQLTLANGKQATINVGNTQGNFASTDGSVLYYGIVADEFGEEFTKVSFNLVDNVIGIQNQSYDDTDVFAFDNLTIGSIEQILKPNPTTPIKSQVVSEATSILNLLGLAVGVIVFYHKKEKKLKLTVLHNCQPN